MGTIADASENVTLAKDYEPYGEVLDSAGSASTAYGYTGEWTDNTGLVYLRARYYDPTVARFMTKDSWGGDTNQPMSYNSWMYGYANPVLYSDPSGYITQSEAPEANSIVQRLRIQLVNINVDWKDTSFNYWWIDPVDSAQNGVRTICGWEEGRWSLNELYIVEGAIQNLNTAMRQKMSRLIGIVSISKVPDACGRGCTTVGHIDLLDGKRLPIQKPNVDLSKYYVVDPSVNFNQWTVVHEMSHAWDARNNGLLSLKLVLATGGWFGPAFECDANHRLPGCNHWFYHYGDIPPKGSDYGFDPREDFAESVTAYVFPTYAQEQVRNYQGTEYEKYFYYTDYTKTKRWAFVNELIVGTTP